jgi:hypothetical protein
VWPGRHHHGIRAVPMVRRARHPFHETMDTSRPASQTGTGAARDIDCWGRKSKWCVSFRLYCCGFGPSDHHHYHSLLTTTTTRTPSTPRRRHGLHPRHQVGRVGQRGRQRHHLRVPVRQRANDGFFPHATAAHVAHVVELVQHYSDSRTHHTD